MTVLVQFGRCRPPATPELLTLKAVRVLGEADWWSLVDDSGQPGHS